MELKEPSKIVASADEEDEPKLKAKVKKSLQITAAKSLKGVTTLPKLKVTTTLLKDEP